MQSSSVAVEGLGSEACSRADERHRETLLDAVRMADVGKLAGKKGTVFAGVGYEYWQNKFGANHATAPGANTSTGMRKAE